MMKTPLRIQSGLWDDAMSPLLSAATVLTFASCWKRLALAFVVAGALGGLPARGHTAGLDCPEIGPAGAVPKLLSELQIKLVASGGSIDLANEISDLVNKLQIDKPNISSADLTDILIAAYCPVVANLANLSDAEKWRR